MTMLYITGLSYKNSHSHRLCKLKTWMEQQQIALSVIILVYQFEILQSISNC